MMRRRLQPRIDDYCLTVIRNASVCVVGFSDQAGIVFINLRATPVLRTGAEHIDLVWPAGTALPPALHRRETLNRSLRFTMPGIGFTIRANGRCSAAQVEDGRTRLAFVADALFLHCLRAKFWEPRKGEIPRGDAAGQAALSDQALAFVSRSPYLLLVTQNAAGRTELSPRGDPDDFVLAFDRSSLLIPERPGNKVACTLTNILSHGLVTVAFLIPSSADVLLVTARCWLTADTRLLEPAAVQGKAPKIGIVLHVDGYRFQHCPESVEAGLWSKDTHPRESDMFSFPKMLAEHMDGTGLLGKATTLLVDAVVKHDLERLY
jgi:predicted pyridoxine 5'-phosphate oxidase superfamily flavin-nucleotide-binding protein